MNEFTYVLTSKSPVKISTIAAHLRTLARTLPEDGMGDRCVIAFGTFRIRCDHSRAAVNLIARRYRKGLWHGGRSFIMPALGRPIKAIRCTKLAVLAFIKDGEEDNLREYLALYPRSEWPIEAIKWDLTQRQTAGAA